MFRVHSSWDSKLHQPKTDSLMMEWRNSKLAHKKLEIVTSFPVFYGNVDCFFELGQLFIQFAIESRLIGICNETKANRARIAPNCVNIVIAVVPKCARPRGHFAALIRFDRQGDLAHNKNRFQRQHVSLGSWCQLNFN